MRGRERRRPADAPTVAVRVDRAEANVGDKIAFSITSVGPRAMPVVLPANLDLAPFAELARDLEETDLGDGKMRREFTLGIAAYEPGSFEIPPVELTYFGADGTVKSVRTQAVPVTIKSLIANEPEPKLKENADSVPVSQRDYLVLYLAGGLAAAWLGAVIALCGAPPPARPAPARSGRATPARARDRDGTARSPGDDSRPRW